MAEVAVFITIRTRPGQRDALHDLWEKHQRPRAEESDDQTSYLFAFDEEDPNVVRISETYANRKAFEANSRSPEFKKYMKEVAPLLDGEPETRVADPKWRK